MFRPEIERAAELLRAGALVAFPTETVYGLGADALSDGAVAKIYAAKGRPAGNPLIVHVSDESMAQSLVAAWPAEAAKLARRFWPGPLTLVLAHNGRVSSLATAGGATVALRCPAHPVAMQLLLAFAGPIAAPSANRSSAVSPTTAEHVRQDLGDRVALVLDGGPCRVGIESTVLSLAGPRPVILRPGSVTREQLEEMLGPVEVGGAVEPMGDAPPLPSPGMLERHYSPRTAAYRVEALASGQALTELPRPLAVMTQHAQGERPGVTVYAMSGDAAGYARELYSTLRAIDAAGFAALLVEMPPAVPEFAAVRDRLTRATRAWPA